MHERRPRRRPSPATTGFTVAVAVSSVLAACSTTTESTRSTSTTGRAAATATAAPATVAPRRAGEADGAYVFRTQCAGCHGTGGEGNVGPPLVGVADRLAAADEVAIVRNGRGRMPAFSPALSDDEIAAVVEHTRTQLR